MCECMRRVASYAERRAAQCSTARARGTCTTHTTVHTLALSVVHSRAVSVSTPPTHALPLCVPHGSSSLCGGRRPFLVLRPWQCLAGCVGGFSTDVDFEAVLESSPGAVLDCTALSFSDGSRPASLSRGWRRRGVGLPTRLRMTTLPRLATLLLVTTSYHLIFPDSSRILAERSNPGILGKVVVSLWKW